MSVVFGNEAYSVWPDCFRTEGSRVRSHSCARSGSYAFECVRPMLSTGMVLAISLRLMSHSSSTFDATVAGISA